MQAMGASVAQLPGREILPAMEKGVIDAFEFNNPTSDMRFGAQDVTKFYYLGSYHQASEAIEVVFNKEQVRGPCQGAAGDPQVAAQATSANGGWKASDIYSNDLQTLMSKHGVQVKRTPESIFKAQLDAWDKVVTEISGDSAQDPAHQEDPRESQKAWAKRVGFYAINNEADFKSAYEHYFGPMKV